MSILDPTRPSDQITDKIKKDTPEEVIENNKSQAAVETSLRSPTSTAQTNNPQPHTAASVLKETESPKLHPQKEANQWEGKSVSPEPEIEEKPYHTMSMESLVKELGSLLKKQKIQTIKEGAEAIKMAFNTKFMETSDQKKEDFLADGGDAQDFYYTTPEKKAFDSLYKEYKDKRKAYYQDLKKGLQNNLKKRLEIIEALKGLLEQDENIKTKYNAFKAIRERWSNAGAIPRDKYNTIWNTFNHHVEHFYDFLNLHRDFRDLDFKYNLEQKLKIIDRTQELTQDTNVNRAFRELQMLHKMWKEDLGPVDKAHREIIWEKFSALTKIIHENRQKHYEHQEVSYQQNLVLKKELIVQIEAIGSTPAKSHKGWQQKIKEIETLRETFLNTGKVPSKFKEETWSMFKKGLRKFNQHKNEYYKDQKKAHFENLRRKQELIKIAEAHKNSEDFETTTPLVKKIQADWKKIGPVPHRDSDKIWKQFKGACNHYFDRVHAQRNETNKEETENYNIKLARLAQLKTLELSGEAEADLKTLNDKISDWKSIGQVPGGKKGIEKDFNKQLDFFFEQLPLDPNAIEMIKYENKLNTMISNQDNYALRNEQSLVRKKIDQIASDIRQLENNLQFFRHADQNNPLVKEVHTNISKHQESLQLWQTKLKKITTLKY